MSEIIATYDPTTETVTLVVPIGSISAPSENRDTGVPSQHAMIVSGRAYSDLDCMTPYGPIRGNVNIGVLVGDLPDAVADAIGVDKAQHAAALLAAGKQNVRRGNNRATVSLSDIKPPAPSPVAQRAAALRKAK